MAKLDQEIIALAARASAAVAKQPAASRGFHGRPQSSFTSCFTVARRPEKAVPRGPTRPWLCRAASSSVAAAWATPWPISPFGRPRRGRAGCHPGGGAAGDTGDPDRGRERRDPWDWWLGPAPRLGTNRDLDGGPPSSKARLKPLSIFERNRDISTSITLVCGSK
jgi:hypothetical protein